MKSLNVVFTIENGATRSTDQSAAIVDINKNEITIKSKIFLVDCFKKAFVALCYGNSSKIFFALDELIFAEKAGHYYIYKFKAPTEKEKKDKYVNLNIDGCSGYNKLLSMIKPKHTGGSK